MIDFTEKNNEKWKNFWHFTLKLILDVPAWIDEDTGLITWATSNGDKTVTIYHDYHEGTDDRIPIWEKKSGEWTASRFANCDTDLAIYFNMYNFQFSIFNVEWMMNYTRKEHKAGRLPLEVEGNYKVFRVNPFEWNVDKPYGNNKIFERKDGKEQLMYFRSAFTKDRILY
jgi:hypothetical protein